MTDPIVQAKWVLQNIRITGIPALALADIASSAKIRFKYADYPNDNWDGTLLFKGEKRVILINTHRGKNGRHNFTFAHELGHYFLDHKPNLYQDGQPIIRCSQADILDKQKPREVEANRFAVELLMPESIFRLDIAGAPIDFELIGGIANRYMVSKQACSYRILGLIQTPCIIIRSNGVRVLDIAFSRAARSFVSDMKEIPNTTAAFRIITENVWHEDFVACKASKWLCQSIPGDDVYECTHVHRESGAAMTIIKW
jgi:Zn-dependent peptidase ImmA (M78 family)